MQNIKISKTKTPIKAEIRLSASKSESNRALIIQALAYFQSQAHIEIENLSDARDTQTLHRLLKSDEQIWDVIDAGTTMRFLTAYLAITNQQKILTGTARMCERPIGILTEALRQLGFEVQYLEKQGFPPLKMRSSTEIHSKKIGSELTIKANVSSQYISALLMIAPLLPYGLTLTLEGHISSKPYIEMTLAQMQYFGITYQWIDNQISIPQQYYQARDYQVESDWSGASYWYSIAGLTDEAHIELLGLKADSLQGDSVIANIMGNFGVQSVMTSKGVLLTKKDNIASIQKSWEDKIFEWNFADCPDLAQTVVAFCSILKIKGLFKGLESLRIKETDRIAALQNEIRKFGMDLFEKEDVFELKPIEIFENQNKITINTYDDHRMAMAFAPLACIKDLEIENPNVVQKSYPKFWEDLKSIGFQIDEE